LIYVNQLGNQNFHGIQITKESQVFNSWDAIKNGFLIVIKTEILNLREFWNCKMSVKIHAHFGTMLKLASALGKARQTGTPEQIAEAQAAHDSYREIILAADTTILGISYHE
jgi:diacylglycerol kinase family enzyme